MSSILWPTAPWVYEGHDADCKDKMNGVLTVHSIMLWLDWSQITPAWCLLDCTILETAKKCRHGSGVVPVVWRKLEGTFRFQVLTCYSPAFFQLFFFLLENNNKGNRTDFSDFQLVQIRQQAGISKETRLQNGGKICRDWSGFVTIWQSRCQSSQSNSSRKHKWLF